MQEAKSTNAKTLREHAMQYTNGLVDRCRIWARAGSQSGWTAGLVSCNPEGHSNIMGLAQWELNSRQRQLLPGKGTQPRQDPQETCICTSKQTTLYKCVRAGNMLLHRTVLRIFCLK